MRLPRNNKTLIVMALAGVGLWLYLRQAAAAEEARSYGHTGWIPEYFSLDLPTTAPSVNF